MSDCYELIVFDLDFTLWDCGGLWCDCTQPPYIRDDAGRVWDSAGREMRLYDGVTELLSSLNYQGYQIALASRTDEPSWANELTRLLELNPWVDYREIYPGSKVKHLKKISKDSGVPLEKMLFFDDEARNIADARDIGVDAVLVKHGLSRELVMARLK